MGGNEMDLESRIDEQEGKIDALLDEIDGRDKIIRDLQAQAAAMREALLLMPEICELAADEAVYTYREIHEQAVKKEIELNELIEKVEAALAPDAGKKLLERLTKAEAERVEAVPVDGRSLCEMAACPHWNDGDCLVLSCGLKYVYDYLLTANMIREAE
jgi:hypothetical protein